MGDRFRRVLRIKIDLARGFPGDFPLDRAADHRSELRLGALVHVAEHPEEHPRISGVEQEDVRDRVSNLWNERGPIEGDLNLDVSSGRSVLTSLHQPQGAEMANPTNIEQEMLELLNRSRADPQGEVNRLIPLNMFRSLGGGITRMAMCLRQRLDL